MNLLQRLLLIALLGAAAPLAWAQDADTKADAPPDAPADAPANAPVTDTTTDDAPAEEGASNVEADEATDADATTDQPGLEAAQVGVDKADEAEEFRKASAAIMQRAEASKEEFKALQQEIADDILPLSRQLSELESKLADKRAELNAVKDTLNARGLKLINLKRERDRLAAEIKFVSDYLADYLRNFKGELSVAELQRLDAALKAAEEVADNPALTPTEKITAQIDVVFDSLKRLEDAASGVRFDGVAVPTFGDEPGIEVSGEFLLFGPIGVFVADDKSVIGAIGVGVESDTPRVAPFLIPEHSADAAALANSGKGLLPVDATRGEAQKIADTKESLYETAQKGGVVMYPIVGMAALAFLVALLKWIELQLVRNPSKRRIRAMLAAVEKGDQDKATAEARAVGGPTGRMLQAGVEHLKMPRELIEEIMYEQVLAVRLRLNRFLPFVQICAASAPLLGLLGTVTGIINTFKLITIYGTGDATRLSGGISEALITTMFGLIVAIPSLLIHAFLYRKARAKVDDMEKAAVALVNQVGKSANQTKPPAPDQPDTGTRKPVSEEKPDDQPDDDDDAQESKAA